MARSKSKNVQINISIPTEWKKELENLSVDCDFPVSASVGYAIGKKECLKDVIAIADHNMYLCKQKAHNERV